MANSAPAVGSSAAGADAIPGFAPPCRWEWVREDPARWSVSKDSSVLTVETAPGSIWGAFGRSKPACNTLVDSSCVFVARPSPAADAGDACSAPNSQAPSFGSFQATVTCACANHGEQAGLLLYTDDDSWVKLVLEGMKDGSSKVVLARSEGGEPAVVCKTPLPAPDSCCSGMTLSLVCSPEAPHTVLASCWPAAAATNKASSGPSSAPAPVAAGECALPATPFRVGLMAHGSEDGTTPSRHATFHSLCRTSLGE